MKYFFRFLGSLFFIIAQPCFGQKTESPLSLCWNNLKIQLQRRADILGNLTVVLSKSTKVDKAQLKNVKTFSVDLAKIIDTLNLAHSRSVLLASDKNNKLGEALSKTLVTLESDSQFKGRSAVFKLMMHLEGCENSIALAKKEYNNRCRELKKFEFVFGKDQPGKASEVKF